MVVLKVLYFTEVTLRFHQQTNSDKHIIYIPQSLTSRFFKESNTTISDSRIT